MALELMARDRGPRLYLGRPCYFETRQDPGCTPSLWTHERYSPEVVQSMAAALREFLRRQPFREVVLIGYSGGGTLAWLMASQVSEVSSVLTIVANLDIDYWARLHGYTSLRGSLNPATLPQLPLRIKQVHYVGGRDDRVPPSVASSFARHHPAARVVEVPQFDHACCWLDAWPEFLERS